jgi:hypothetical protein
MMLIAIASLKNAPGVTTFSLALAVRWPRPMRSVLVECDPSGGSIATRFRLTPNPGLATLTAAARRDSNPHLLQSHVQHLPGGLPVLCAPAGAQFTHTALTALLDNRRATVSVFRAAAVPDTVVIADCGRLDPGSPAMAIAQEADRVLLLTHPRTDDLCCLAADLAMVNLWSLRPHLVLVGPGHSSTEVVRELGVPAAGCVPHDPAGARALCGYAVPYPRRRLGPHRSRLGDAALVIAHALLTSPFDRFRACPSPFERPVMPAAPRDLAPLSPNPMHNNGHRL